MKLYLLERTDVDKDHTPYDEYDSLVVCANSEEDAKSISPGRVNDFEIEWVPKEYIKVTYLGLAYDKIERGVICKSFNAE